MGGRQSLVPSKPRRWDPSVLNPDYVLLKLKEAYAIGMSAIRGGAHSSLDATPMYNDIHVILGAGRRPLSLRGEPLDAPEREDAPMPRRSLWNKLFKK